MSRRRDLAGKITRLASAPGTEGEGRAAAAALTRIAATPAKQPQAKKGFSDGDVRKLPTPAKGNKVYYDSAYGGLKGFGVRVTASGAQSFILNYSVRDTGREKRYTIGSFPDWTTGAARIEARRLKQEVDRGADPLGDIEDAREAPTVSELIARFEKEHLTKKRDSTADAYKSWLRIHIGPSLGRLKVAEVTVDHVEAMHRRLSQKISNKLGYKGRHRGGAYVANRCLAVTSKMFSMAIRWNMRSDNPAKGIERNPEIKIKRYLVGDELARITAALAKHHDKQAANIIRLLLLTGARRGEVLSMRWSDIDLTTGKWVKPGSTTKQTTEHEVPLSAPARQLLSEIADEQAAKRPKRVLGEFVFPSNGATGHIIDVKKSWHSICKAARIEKRLRLHDLRHSFASELVSGGASLPLIGALLGHSNPITTSRYAHLKQDPQRAAVERIGAVVTAAGNGGPTPKRGSRRGRRHADV
jgi:integrase